MPSEFSSVIISRILAIAPNPSLQHMGGLSSGAFQEFIERSFYLVSGSKLSSWNSSFRRAGIAWNFRRIHFSRDQKADTIWRNVSGSIMLIPVPLDHA